MEWCKLWAEWGTDPKVQSMSESMRCRHVLLLCLRCSSDVTIHLSDDEIAFYMRITLEELAETKAVFLKRGFIDKHWNVLKWDKRQSYISKPVSPGAIRMRALRERERHALRNSGATETSRVAQLAPASEEQSREEQRRGDAGTPAETPPLISLGPEYKPIGELAIELSGELSWGSWVDAQGRFGHPARWIELALRRAMDAGKLQKPYVAAILRGWASDGGPPAESSNGKVPALVPVEVTPEEKAKVQADLDAWAKRAKDNAIR